MDSETSSSEVQGGDTEPVGWGEADAFLPGADDLESEEFDCVAYVNNAFPTEQALTALEAAVARCEYRASAVDEELQRLARELPARRVRGQRALVIARQHVAELALQLADVDRDAERNRTVVQEITSEIKQLDCAKTNLTAAITALNHFHMLVGGADTLRKLAHNRLYREIVLPLQACTEVLQHFENYRDIKQISEVRDDVHRIRAQLSQQILHDFKEAFTAGSKSSLSHKTLAEACLVVEVLDVKVKNDLIKWFMEKQLQEYRHLFSAEQEAAWLDRVERRYAWLKRHLLTFEDTLGALFPSSWGLSELIAKEFCQVTRSELSSIMTARRSEIDVKLLLYAIQKTYNFELLLHKRFDGSEINSDTGTVESGEQAKVQEGVSQPASPWLSSIGSCFEPYLSLYIDSLDSNLRELMDRFIQDAKAAGAECESGISGAGAGSVFSSCAELFLFYKKCLVQCAQLSTGLPMLELSGVFAKYLREYAASVLQASLTRCGGNTQGLHTLHTLQALLRDDATGINASRLGRGELCAVCGVLTTAEYCLETTTHLELKLREKLSPTYTHRLTLAPEQDLFREIISHCIQMLVQELELSCEPALSSMPKLSWLNFQCVGDQSSYVTQLVMTLRNFVPLVRERLSSSRKYFTQFCIRFASSFIPKFIGSVYRCKPISTVGSEQLLLDTHMLKTALLELPSIGSEVTRPAPATYSKVVVRLMGKAEMVLKLVMAPLGSPESFATQFAQLVPEPTLQDLHRVLDMKAVRLSRTQQTQLDAAFRQVRDPAHNGSGDRHTIITQ